MKATQMKLYYNPVSSYSQKVVMAFHEKGLAFTPEIVNLMAPESRAAYEKVYPIGKVPALYVEEQGLLLPESSVIVAWLEDVYANQGTRLIPADKAQARTVDIWDRFADNYLNEPMQKIFFDGMRPQGERDPRGVAQARALLDKAYQSLEKQLSKTSGQWLLGDSFTLADCAAAPSLNYAKMVHPFANYPLVSAYAARLQNRPSFAKAFAEAAPILAAMTGNKA